MPAKNQSQARRKQRFSGRGESNSNHDTKSRSLSIGFLVGLLVFEVLVAFQIRLVMSSNDGNHDYWHPSPVVQQLLDGFAAPSRRSSRSDHHETLAYLEQLAGLVLRSYAGDGTLASRDRHRPGFEVALVAEDPSAAASKPSNRTTCRCDLVSTECLDTIACRLSDHRRDRTNALVWIGLELRRTIQATAQADRGKNAYAYMDVPLGKALQYNAMDSWRAWRSKNQLPADYEPKATQIFAKEDRYAACRDATTEVRKGLSCFYDSPLKPENTSGTLEHSAREWFERLAKPLNMNPKETTRQSIRDQIAEFLQQHQPHPEEHREAVPFSPLGNLLLFAHVTRMMFHRRPFLDEIYRDKLSTIVVARRRNQPNGTTANNSEPFVVALHMRRGDSCGDPDPKLYRPQASPIESRAQTGGDRLCYHNSVYLGAIRRIRRLVPDDRPLHVYLATDHMGDVLQEILGPVPDSRVVEVGGFDTSIRSVVDEWHFLNYSRAHFQYEPLSIEYPENEAKQPMLGETAVSDLWLLSHGDAFVGHLGSRFGKVSWLLAMARRNDFVPFFSVDGRSFCCEIDENCGAMAPYITVDNCLAFGHDYFRFDHDNYWEEGSLARKKYYLENMTGPAVGSATYNGKRKHHKELYAKHRLKYQEW